LPSLERRRRMLLALLVHVLTDACGVRAARFRLGRPDADPATAATGGQPREASVNSSHRP
jgi:hypothetical protein